MKLEITSFWTASALGTGNEETFANLLAGRAPGMREISGDIPERAIWFGSVLADLPEIAEPRWNMRTNRLLALASDALKDEIESLVARYGRDRVGIVLGSSNTGIDEAEGFIDKWLDDGGSEEAPAVPPPDGFEFTMIELGTTALFLKERLGVDGPAYTVSTACSSSANAFASAARLIETGVCDAVVTGGVDGRCRFAMNGFAALGALSEGRCRPFAPDRDGINLGEGVGLFLLERPSGAAAPREGGARRVFLEGVGESSDAYHATAPDPSGAGALRAMLGAVEASGMPREAFDYVNFHGTGTVANDDMESRALAGFTASAASGCSPRSESTKSLTGHCLGAAGAGEAAICALLIKDGRCGAALSNSFAFGGSNGTVALSGS